ncbi:MAG: DUF692 domain-containing protein [Spirochaetota bacterium]
MDLVQIPSSVGIGLRSQHFHEILSTKPDVPWFEALTDNYLNQGGPAYRQLLQVREYYPMALHGVALSLGSYDPLDKHYLQELKSLKEAVEPAWVSDHVCWTSYNGLQYQELLPLSFTEEVLQHVAKRIAEVQSFLGEQILVENTSSYFTYKNSTLSEWEFLGALAEEADCLLLLDVNNVYVNSVNHRFDPKIYIQAIDPKRVAQIHLAGFAEQAEGYLLDTHGSNVSEKVSELFQFATKHLGKKPTIVEWDTNIPSLQTLQEEAQKAERILTEITD